MTVVTHYYRELLNFLSRSVRDREVASDLVQESYARLLAVQSSGKPITNPRALLYRTARNLVIDEYRRADTRGEFGPSSDGDEAADPIELSHSLVAPNAYEPEVAAASTESVNALLATIGALPLRCREAFLLHKFDGLSQAEVAAQMGISVKMVERHVKLAMEACRLCKRQVEGTDTPRSSTTESISPQ